MLLCGCALSAPVGLHAFRHPDGTFAFRNETLWSYAPDPLTGRQVHQPRVPQPTYTLRCFVMARAVKLFHAQARFAPDLPAVGDDELRRRLRSLLRRSPRAISPEKERIVFPGFADLRTLSAAHEPLLKAEAGGAWQSYFQRGHWRMILPFTRRGQEREAADLLKAVRENRAPVLHVFTFPALTVNHAVVLFAAEESAGQIIFHAYDPNLPDEVLLVSFRRATRSFELPPTAYFIGGPVNAYEVYRGFWR